MLMGFSSAFSDRCIYMPYRHYEVEPPCPQALLSSLYDFPLQFSRNLSAQPFVVAYYSLDVLSCSWIHGRCRTSWTIFDCIGGGSTPLRLSVNSPAHRW